MTLRKEIMELANRKLIYEYISNYPGLHLREICRKLEIPRSTLNYHLKYLQKHNLISTKHESIYTRFYVKNSNGVEYQKLLHFLRQNTPRDILLYMFTYICASQAELSEALEKNPTTIMIHLKRLKDANIIEPVIINNGVIHTSLKKYNIIERAPITTEKIYRIKNRNLLIKVILDNRNKLFDDTTKNILYMVKKLSREGLPKKLQTSKKSIDSVEKVIYEVLPHPYYV